MYTTYAPVATDPISSVGSVRNDTRTIGLPEGYWKPQGQIKSNELLTTFTGSASTQHQSPENYTFTESVTGTSVSETLPSGLLQNGWDIAPIGPSDLKGGYVSFDGTSLSYTPKLTASDQADLNYK